MDLYPNSDDDSYGDFSNCNDECDLLDQPSRSTEREHAQMDQIEAVVRNSGMYDINDGHCVYIQFLN